MSLSSGTLKLGRPPAIRITSYNVCYTKLLRSETPAAKAPAAPASFQALGELYESLRDMAIRDPLTGTYNRALLEDRLKLA